MAEHALPGGRKVIEALLALGRGLGYIARAEAPVIDGIDDAQANDVVWVTDKDQVFPLMLFEVESASANTAANNAVKVWAKPNTVFQKPLFFFHVYLTGDERSSRIDDLVGEYGRNNYRAYRLRRDGAFQLLRDVLEQHRRLKRVLHLSNLLDSIHSNVWMCELTELLQVIESLGFEDENGSWLAVYARLARDNTAFAAQYRRRLLQPIRNHLSEFRGVGFQNYMGDWYAEAVNCSLLALWDETNVAAHLQRFRGWQYDERRLAPMLRPDFGLSFDHDTFVLSIAPSMWGLFAVLFHRHDAAMKYFLKECLDILRNVNPKSFEDISNCGCWALHLAAEARDEVAFEEVRSVLNGQGGLPALLHREAHAGGSSVQDNHEWKQMLAEPRTTVPDIVTFKMSLSRKTLSKIEYAQRASQLALACIAHEECLDWGPDISTLLHAAVIGDALTERSG